LGREHFVAKRFTDWHGFKWFTLNLVSLGSKLFSVSGKARMTNEYGINRYLSKKGLNVPEIVNVNMKLRILVERYISGVPLSQFVSEAVNSSALSKPQYRLAEAFGETLATIHAAGVAVGDAKPENFVAKDNDIYTVDLEQARKDGDRAWDIAELLFYSGHYSGSTSPTRGLTEVVKAFIHGYLRSGDAGELKRSSGARYLRVFSLWTSAPIIIEISRLLREAR
jgi:tRNA A-37 threonylcarbamoyl transferase component Bud32